MQLMGQRVVFVTGPFLKHICSSGTIPETIVEGLPADAELLRIVPDFSTNGAAARPKMGAVFQSREWEPLEEGSQIPELVVAFRRAE